MKTLIITLFLAVTLLVSRSAMYAQCCPYINSISIMPDNPTGSDEIQIMIEVSTPNLGSKISKHHYLSNDTIFLEACYYSGYLTQPQGYADTFDVGVLNPGEYIIYLTAYQSFNQNYCDSGDHQIETSLLEVKQMTGIVTDNDQRMIEWYPNPVDNLFFINGSEIKLVTISNLNGQVMFRENVTHLSSITIDLKFLIPGVYFMEVMDMDRNFHHGKIVKK